MVTRGRTGGAIRVVFHAMTVVSHKPLAILYTMDVGCEENCGRVWSFCAFGCTRAMQQCDCSERMCVHCTWVHPKAQTAREDLQTGLPSLTLGHEVLS